MSFCVEVAFVVQKSNTRMRRICIGSGKMMFEEETIC